MQTDESRHARKKPKVKVTPKQPAVTFQYGTNNGKFEVPERIVDLREPDSGEGSESPQYTDPEHAESKTKDELIDEEVNALKPTYKTSKRSSTSSKYYKSTRIAQNSLTIPTS